MDTTILNEVNDLADNLFRPRAEAADQSDIYGPVGENIRELARRGYYGLGIGREHGGFEADEATKREYLEILSSACGVTAFTQQQLHSGGGMVGGARHPSLKKRILPKLASGEILCGVGFSHLRRPGPPMMEAVHVDGGCLLNGRAPWVSAWSMLDSFILGATVGPHHRSHMFLYIDIKNGGEAIKASKPLPTMVMNASDTVEVTLENLFVPAEEILHERPTESMRRGDHSGIAGNVFGPLGCARGSIHFLRKLAERPGRDSLVTIANSFQREVDECRQQALIWDGSKADLPDYKENALSARAAAIILAVRAAHALVAATGGSAHLLANPAQRLLREAVFYTTQAQTPDVQSGTLERLVASV